MDINTEKIETILGVIQLKNCLKDEDRIEENQLRSAVGEEVSNELYYLQESNVIELAEASNQNYIRFTEDTSDELGDEKPPNIYPEIEELDEFDEELERIEDDDLLDGSMELKHPEKYVAALKPFGEAVDHNPEIELSEHHITSYVGEDLSFHLRTLAEWGYLTEVETEQTGLISTDSNFYRLNIEDIGVRADAIFSAKHIDEHYDGSVERFLHEYSERDSDALRKNGVKFYKAIE